ncbi:hypothetical protein BJX70DRAFT_402054 [Aspergillus crustosus]
MNETQPADNSRPQKVLVTEKDHAVQHWLDYDRLPGRPHINPFYAPYCARLNRSFILHSQPSSQATDPEVESGNSRRIAYDSDAWVEYLTTNYCFVGLTEGGPTEGCEAACQNLLMAWHSNLPRGTGFDEGRLRHTLAALDGESEMAIIQIIGRLLVPVFAFLPALPTLIATGDRLWGNMIPLDEGFPNLHGSPVQPFAGPPKEEGDHLPQPKPTWSVGFSSQAFTAKQRLKLNPFLGQPDATSFFKATAILHSLFMVSKVKSDTACFHLALYESMHIMALALRGIVYLFQLVNRGQELNRTILGFSVTHNSHIVRMHGYYPVIRGSELSYHAHEISSFFLSDDTKWNAYKFVMAIYEHWAPRHLERICSAIDQLPDSILSPETYDGGDGSELLQDLAGSAVWDLPYKKMNSSSWKAVARSFGSWILTPLGLAITLYGLNVIAWGGMLLLLMCNAAPAMCNPSCNNLYSPRRIWIEIDSQILNALFCVTGIGIAPWRIRDLYQWCFWRLGRSEATRRRGLDHLAEIYANWFYQCPEPSHLPIASGDSRSKSTDSSPTPGWKLDVVVWGNTLNTVFLICLAVCMRAMNRFTRPSWATGLIVGLACVAAGIPGIVMWLEKKRIREDKEHPGALLLIPRSTQSGLPGVKPTQYTPVNHEE